MPVDQLERLRTALAGRYHIERELGRGGMATVYQAEDLKHHRKVAVKVLRPELAALPWARSASFSEITTTANLRHPHILPLYDSGTVQVEAVLGSEVEGLSGETSDLRPSTLDPRPWTALYYVMPLVEGESLRDRLTRERQLPLDEALRLTREVADALGYAHSQGVIHRDIKPENILLERGHAVVADFGIARAVASAGADKLTQTGVAVGTPSYMSPEQSVGETDLDGRSDLYSLGCVLYEMLAGEPPYTGLTVRPSSPSGSGSRCPGFLLSGRRYRPRSRRRSTGTATSGAGRSVRDRGAVARRARGSHPVLGRATRRDRGVLGRRAAVQVHRRQSLTSRHWPKG